MRLGSTSSCGQSISINDGGIPKTFDCSKNNDYLPTLLYTSLSYFIRINISDNHGSAAGYYFLLLEGKNLLGKYIVPSQKKSNEHTDLSNTTFLYCDTIHGLITDIVLALPFCCMVD